MFDLKKKKKRVFLRIGEQMGDLRISNFNKDKYTMRIINCIINIKVRYF